MNLALLVMRLVFGLLFVGHGSQKLFGVLGGYGPRGTASFLEGMGFHPALPMAFLVGASEAGGGLLLVLGLVQPLAAVLIIGAMATAAVSAHWGKGIWAPEGIEYPLICATIAFALAGLGPGRWSLDRVLPIHLSGTWWALGALAVGLSGSASALLTRKRPVAS